MVQVTIFDSSGDSKTIEGRGGQTLMEAAVDHGISAIEAICGGACACGTCHVWIDAAWTAVVGPPSKQEAEMLEGIEGANSQSRLSCQIRLAPALNGLVITTPAHQTDAQSTR